MGISAKFAQAREKLAKETSSRSIWESIMPRISQGVVVPVISSSFRIEQIFREEGESPPGGDGMLSIHEQLVSEWATLIEYPLQDKNNLARVAQYYLVEQKDNPVARSRYLDVLKSFLLMIAQEDANYSVLATRLKTMIREMTFSEIVHQLDYPRIPANTEDPLRLLARLPLPLYVTTSQSDFLERALEAEEKMPRTQVCFWSGEVSAVMAKHQTDPNFRPTVTAPMVYHLYGLEDYPQTLVLSEDDYLNFLVAMVEDTNTLNPLVPLSVRRALGTSHLMLLGYGLSDWDFRVLFRFILKFRKEDFSPRGMVIQLGRNERSVENVQRSLEYLGRYFDRRKFDIEWENPECFIQKLWDEWCHYRQGRL